MQTCRVTGSLSAVGKQAIRHHLHAGLQHRLKPGKLIDRQWLTLGGLGFYAVGIYRFSVNTRLVVYMGTCCLAGPTHFGDRLTLFDTDTFFHQQAAAVTVVGLVPVGMAEDH